MKHLYLFILLMLIAVPVVSGQTQDPKKQDPKQDDPDVLKVKTGLVSVPVIVTDRWGRLISGLKRSDFSVSEDGVKQAIDEFSAQEAPFNVALLIDTSRSTAQKLGIIRKTALEFVKQLQPRDSLLIVTFDEKVRFIGEFSNNENQLRKDIKKIESSYMTSLYDAIYKTITEKMSRVTGRKAIVILSDGIDTYSKTGTYENSLELANNAGVICYSVQYDTRNAGMKPSDIIPRNYFLGGGRSSGFKFGLASYPSYASNFFSDNKSELYDLEQEEYKRDRYLIATEFLQSLAIQTGGRHIRAENIENTSYAFAVIANELRYQYTLTYLSPNDDPDGKFHNIKVKLLNPDLLVRTRLGYRAVKE